MKRLLYVFLVTAVIIGCCGCLRKADEKPEALYGTMIENAVWVLKDYWKNEIYLLDDNVKPGEGYLQIVNTRVIKIKGEPDTVNDTQIFDDVDYVIEFVLFSNYFYTAPFYNNAYGQHSHVIVYEDGTMEVSVDIFDMYRGMTYSSDFSGIIEEVTDLGDVYDGVFILK